MPEKATPTTTSVTVIPASGVPRFDELHTKAEVALGTVAFPQFVVRGILARYGPKFEPVTMMLLRRCEVAIDGEGVS